MSQLSRKQVVAARVHAQQLDREPDEARSQIDADVFDLGVQNSGRDAASWALANRGVPVATASALDACGEVALAWTLRGAPAFYRRDDLSQVATAVSPFSEADAARRLGPAAKSLAEAGIAGRESLAVLAAELRKVVDRPRVKGEVSTRITERLAAPYLRDCRVCKAIHPYESAFRLAALHAGLELEPGTSPPVLRRIPGWPRRRPGPAVDPFAAPPALQPIRGYLRFLGPATPADVAGFLDTSVTEVKQNWPADAAEVEVDGTRRWMLGEADTDDPGPTLVRLLGPFDLLLQGQDRSTLVPDAARHRELWPTLGRPGAVLVGSVIVGTWRPQTKAKRLVVRLDPWHRLPATVHRRIETQAERLAAHRGADFAGVTST